MSKWDFYKNTLDNINNNINIFSQMIIYYYKLIIDNKLNDLKYIKVNYKLDTKFTIFKKYILDEKNLGIFTLFNNIPDIIHPLEDELYMEYGMYLSFIKFNNDNIIIKKENLFKNNFYKYPFVYQNIAPYNINKKYIFLNIKYFKFNDYISYAILFITDNKNIYSYNKNILKKKEINEWKIVNNNINEFKNIIYVCILRPINKEDITNTFNSYYKINKDTQIYSYNENKKSINDFSENTNNNLNWFSFNKNELLNDPFKTWYKKNDEVYLHYCLVLKNIKCLNLSIDILSNNKIKNTLDISDFLNNSTNKENTIFNANLNYINYSKNNIFKNNKGKRLLNEIYFKSSNFVISDKYYFDFLNKYNIYYIVNSYGYYNKLNKFYNYEIGFSNDFYSNKFIKLNKIKKVIL
jgi:hypothetical protein